MTRLTEQQCQSHGEQEQPPGPLERPHQVPVAPDGLIERNYPHDENDDDQNDSVEEGQVTGSGEANAKIGPRLDCIDTGLHPVIGRNHGHLLLNLLVTISIAVLLMVGPGLSGLITFINFYLFSVALVFGFVVPTALVEVIMNTWRKSRNLPSKPFIFPYDEVLEFEGALPYINTARIVFMIVALAFFAQGEVAPDNGSGAGSSLMIVVTALFSIVADAIPLSIIIRFRKDAAQ